MPRVNPQVEALERENRMLREQIKRMREEPGDVPFDPCDNSCVVTSKRGGMMTNGGCRCDERKLRRATMWWKRRAEFLQISVQDLKNELAEANNKAAAALELYYELDNHIDTASRWLNDSTRWESDETIGPKFQELRNRAGGIR